MKRVHRYAMVIDTEACVHCAACVASCRAENAVPPGHSRNRLTERECGAYPALVLEMSPVQWMQCDDAPCVRVCPGRGQLLRRERRGARERGRL